MSRDFVCSAVTPKCSIGQRIYEHISEECVIDREPWVQERIGRIMARFQDCGGLQRDYEVIVPWISTPTAFTAPGRFIFFTRSLFQQCATDDMAAFVIAHEISHHQLGHLAKFPAFVADSIKSDIQLLTAALYRVLVTRIHGPEDECDADRNAIDLCVRAGYDAFGCLKLFDRLEKMALDIGDIKGAYGPNESDDELDEDASMLTKVQIWLYQRKRGYLPIRDRREMLLQHLNSSFQSNTTLSKTP